LHHIGLFEMRRLEALSNTIFGVAMTLLAYDLPVISASKPVKCSNNSLICLKKEISLDVEVCSQRARCCV